MRCTLYNNRILQYNNAELPSGSAFFLSVFSPEKVVFLDIKNWKKLYFFVVKSWEIGSNVRVGMREYGYMMKGLKDERRKGMRCGTVTKF